MNEQKLEQRDLPQHLERPIRGQFDLAKAFQSS